jgi:hypothetical protein
VSAVRLRSGEPVYLTREGELYHGEQCLTHLVPGQRPEGLFLGGDVLLVTTATCVVRLWLGEGRATIETGHCQEAPQMREGPVHFARFNRIEGVGYACGGRGCALLVLDTGQRLCLAEGGFVSCRFVAQRAQAVSLAEGWTVAVAWAGGGLSRFAWGGEVQIRLRVTLVAVLLLPQAPYTEAFVVSAEGQVYRVGWPHLLLLSLERLPFAGGRQLSLEYPFGLYVTDLGQRRFHLMRNLGCLCAPGHALQAGHCQPSPAGGYVNLLGQFVACRPGSYAPLPLGTAAQACVGCPPGTYTGENQSAVCRACGGRVDPSASRCLRAEEACPNGTLALEGRCGACAEGQTGVRGVCAQCPEGTYSDPARGLYTCAACEEEAKSRFCPQACVAREAGVWVSSVNVLGVRPVDLAVARNGTLYLAAYRTLVVVDRSGGSVAVAVQGLVRGLALGGDERVLYAAVMGEEGLLCLAAEGTQQWQCPVAGVRAAAGVRWWRGALAVWDGAVVLHSTLRRQFEAPIVAMGGDENVLLVMLRGEGQQSVVKSVEDGAVWAQGAVWNPFLAVWRGRLVLSRGHAVVGLAGAENASGRVDGAGDAARFSSPGPMAVAPQAGLLLVADQTGVRVVHDQRGGCQCEGDFFYQQGCRACPVGLSSLAGARTCTTCAPGQYTEGATGACVPCARTMWWDDGPQPCPPLVDTLVPVDAGGLSLDDILSALLLRGEEELLLMGGRDYVSLQTLVLPLPVEAMLQDAAARARFWRRLPSVTRAPRDARLVLPGLWVRCSRAVLATEPCTCELPERLVLGGAPWEAARAAAGRIDYATLAVQVAPVPPTALFVARIDGGGGTVDGAAPIALVPAAPPVLRPSASQSAFSVCVAGWPATYACAAGQAWVAPLQECVPCKAGFFAASAEPCAPCPAGSFAAGVGSTACARCDSARWAGQSACEPLAEGRVCGAGLEPGAEEEECRPCRAGFSKAWGRVWCGACAPGSYAAGEGSTGCSACASATQWGSSACVPCAVGFVAAAGACRACAAGWYFAQESCVRKGVVECPAGTYLEDGGPYADNRCRACEPCAEGHVLVPYAEPPFCTNSTRRVGAPYRCVRLETLPGQFGQLSFNVSSLEFGVQYTACEGLPAYASWVRGPLPWYCYFECRFAVQGPISRQYLFFYSLERAVVDSLPPNVFPLDYPGLDADLMLLAGRVCLPCPTSQCPWGTWRPTAADGGCGPPLCGWGRSCQVMEAGVALYSPDGCTERCSRPANAHLTGLALPGQGDACAWECNFGFFLEEGVCVACAAAACAGLDAEFRGPLCLPTSRRTDFCVPCAASAIATLAPQRATGTCEYVCLPNVSYQHLGECRACDTRALCATGQRRVCAERPCVACPPLPSSMWTSAMAMPSNTEVCQVACMDGHHTLDARTGAVLQPPAFSYGMGTIACAPCHLRRHLPCPGRTCPPGYYMPVPGSGVCAACAVACGVGLTLSGCFCTQCAAPASQLLMHVEGRGCAAVCVHNHHGSCSPCAALNTPTLSFYAVWNASNGTRWWPAAQDPPHLPPRSGAPERRAGLCWPCPPERITVAGDADLCLSSSSVVVGPIIVAQEQHAVDEGFLFSMRSMVLSLLVGKKPRRSLLSAAPLICPPFAYGAACEECSPGFVRAAGGGCTWERVCGAARRVRAHAGGASLRLIIPAPHHHHQAAAADEPRAALQWVGCAPGWEWTGACTPCALGHFSRHRGFGPCLRCPSHMTTVAEGSVSPSQCLVQRVADGFFVQPSFIEG